MTRKSYHHIGRRQHPVDAAFWEQCYEKGEVFWDHGEPSPGLVDFLAQERYAPGSVLVPGCGRGHDCRALARAGFDVTGIDISHRGIEEAREIQTTDDGRIRYVVGDCLRLQCKMQGVFDWVFEHTCFCAVDPDDRDRYVEAMTAVLKPRGYLLGVFYNIQPESGPPFGTTREELLERFGQRYELLLEKVPRSYPNREGKEFLMLWRKNS